MSKKLLSSIALSTAMLGGVAGANYSYYSSFGSQHRVPNWQRINNFNSKPIKHINHKRKSMKRR